MMKALLIVSALNDVVVSFLCVYICVSKVKFSITYYNRLLQFAVFNLELLSCLVYIYTS